MSRVRWLTASLVCGAYGLLAAAPGCGSDAVGVGECREIERARCEVGSACGLVSDLDACRRFYRDHCLHGLSLEESPSKQRLDRCTNLILALAACVKNLGADASYAECGLQVPATLEKACGVVESPEQTEACAFLVPDQPPVPDASGAETGPADAGAD